jgi:hypothetical protein
MTGAAGDVAVGAGATYAAGGGAGSAPDQPAIAIDAQTAAKPRALPATVAILLSGNLANTSGARS